MKTFQDFSPYNALHWLVTKRFNVQKTLSVQTTNCSKGL